MSAEDNVDELIKQFTLAQGELLKGNSEPAKKAPPKKKAPAKKKKASAGWIPVEQGWSVPPSSLHV